MNLTEKFLNNEVFSVLIKIKNSLTEEEICKCYYESCHTVTEESTGHTGIKDRSGNLYITYERLLYSNKVFFRDNKLLEITFYTK